MNRRIRTYTEVWCNDKVFISSKIKMHELPVQSDIFVAFVEYMILDYLVGFAP